VDSIDFSRFAAEEEGAESGKPGMKQAGCRKWRGQLALAKAPKLFAAEEEWTSGESTHFI
jgi:hypothetical protein